MHGCGNDLIMIDNRDGALKLEQKQVRSLCDRHFGVGADGLILMESSDKADCFMNYYNGDGQTVEMCGNGVRCIADFYRQVTGHTGDTLSVDTRDGVKEIQVVGPHEYAVTMGVPLFESTDFPLTDSRLFGFEFSFCSFGNPHAVAYIENLEQINLEAIGPNIEHHPYFPNRINVEFVELVARDHIKLAVWERGCGITLACGTGACAAFTIGRKRGLLDAECRVMLPGGALTISELEDGRVVMAGPAETVYSASIDI